MTKKYELIIFDLDGTLLDTSKGIFNSVRYAENQMGFASISDLRLREFVGPPPKAMYMNIYGVDEETAIKAAQMHRKYGLEKAVFEAEVYDGVEDMLGFLKKSGYKLAVASLKAQGTAEKVLQNFGLSRYFDAIVGMDEKEYLTKKDTILLALQQTDTNGVALMVGDSQYDCAGAEEAGVDFVGALYGFEFNPKEKYSFRTITCASELCKLLTSSENV